MEINLDQFDETQKEFIKQYNTIYQKLKNLNLQINQLQLEANYLIDQLNEIRKAEEKYNQKITIKNG